MRKRIFLTVVVFISVCLFAQVTISCNNEDKKNIVVAADDEAMQLGRHLFFDRRLSVNNTRSCGTCHNPSFAFTDGYKRSLGAYADLHQRNTQPLFNLRYLKYFTAADSTLHSPLQQMDNPLFGTHPAEMGVSGNEEKILRKISDDKDYQQMFASVNKEISWANIKTAISLFVGSLQSFNSPYDKYIGGDLTALSESQLGGKELFFSAALKCTSCHGGFNFSTPSVTGEKGDTIFYFNTGLYDIDGKGGHPAYDKGLYQLTKNKADMGKFRVPSLRNLAFTAPYFHDGTAASLTEVIDAYANGGRQIEEGVYKGDGRKNPFKHHLIDGFTISEREKINLISFLQCLSDTSFISNPEYQNPFSSDETKKK